MTDRYESRLRAELQRMANAVPTMPEVQPTEKGRQVHARTKVRSALPVGSLIGAVVVVAAIVGVASRLGPASGTAATATPSELASPSSEPTASPTIAGVHEGSFVATGSMAFTRMNHRATLLADGRVLIAGGQEGSGVADPTAAEIYDPATGKFSPAGSMSSERIECTATLLLDGRVLIAGSAQISLASAELYDPKTGRFSPTGSMSVRRGQHTATLLKDGRALIAGGINKNGSIEYATAELYDPKTGRFSATGSMATGRNTALAVRLPDGRVLMAGGWYEGVPVLTAEIYDPATGKFSATGTMLAGTPWGLQATALKDGRVLFTTADQSQVYDPATGAFTATGSMRVPRRGASLTLLPSGKVLLLGGSVDGVPPSLVPELVEHMGTPPPSVDDVPSPVAELYDPSTGTFTVIEPMTAARDYGHTATLLKDGRVLITGGYGITGDPLASAELYVP